jgi:hypothetical protein
MPAPSAAFAPRWALWRAACPGSAPRPNYCRSLAKALLGRTRRAVVPVQLTDGSRLLLDPRGRTEASAFYLGKLDNDDLDFFRCCIGPAAVALDIGANIGLVSMSTGSSGCERWGESSGRLSQSPPTPNGCGRTSNLNELTATVTAIELRLGRRRRPRMEIGRENTGGAETGNAVLRPGAAEFGAALEWSTVPRPPVR